MKERKLLAGEATDTVLRSDMQIVIPDDATVLCRRSAGRLAQALTLDGLEPAIVTGQDATARQTVRMTLGNGGMTYRVTADGAGNCNLTAGCDRALQQAVLELCGKVKNGRLPQISAVEGNAENLLRVMYYNVYGYGNLDSVPDRLGQQAALIADAAPDVLCVQEFDRLHRAGAKPLLEKAGYSEVPVTEDGGFLYPAGKNCEAIFYRADRLEAVALRRRTLSGPRGGGRCGGNRQQQQHQIHRMGNLPRADGRKDLSGGQYPLYVECAGIDRKAGECRAGGQRPAHGGAD